MSRISCLLACLSLALSSPAESQYYPPSMDHSGEMPGIGRDYALYLKPVLVDRSAPMEVMYLALDGKQVFLYPSAFHLLPYPLQHRPQQGGEDRVNHHAEGPVAVYPLEEDESYSGSEDQPQHRASSNDTQPQRDYSQIRAANTTKVPPKKRVAERL